MPRIKLAFWHGDKGPGEELDVTDADLAALRRDGRVATVLDPPAPGAEGPEPDEATTSAVASAAPAESRSRKAR
ncbi:hypothetical protein AB0I87_18760 [Streptomyces sp. NPDC049952]